MILDLGLPYLNGKAIFRRLGPDLPQVPRIALTAQMEQRGHEEWERSVFRSVLRKATTERKLVETVIRVLERARGAPAL